MTAQLLDGKKVSTQLKQEVRAVVQQRQQQGLPAPGLAVVLVGDHAASAVYVRHKHLACEETGIRSFAHHLPHDTTQDALLKQIDALNRDPAVHGILIQLPLPSHIDNTTILEAIDPRKDVDGFHPYNLGRLAQKHPLLRPCTPYGIMLLLQHYQIALRGLNAVVIGASNIVGRPMMLELLLAACTVTCCHRFTRNLPDVVNQGDLVVAAIGHPGVIQSEWIKPGAIVIDVGITRSEEGGLTGDIDFDTAQKTASWITPVPGGVGPMTIAALLKNTCFAAES